MTFIAFGASWQLAAGASQGLAASSALAPLRADTVARGGLALSGRAAASPDIAVKATPMGSMLSLYSGVPITIVDAGKPLPLRAPRGSTVADVLDLAGVKLGPLDTLGGPADGTIASGQVIRVVRVSETEVTVREAVPFGVKTIDDSTMAKGKTVVVTAGVLGVAENTYQVRLADGTETGRVLVASNVVSAAVPEVRRVGTYVAPVVVPAGGDIETIIRNAAAAWGADPTQMLRVAYCESHYNPNAVNASSGASGLFQFLPSTWAYQAPKAGYGGASVFDPVANANVAARMFGLGMSGQWVCK